MPHEQFSACIDACNACAAACAHCSVACLREPDPKPMARCIALDMDCAGICRLAAEYMARGSEKIRTICSACAVICDACAEECGKHPMDHCRACAEACERCAAECRRVASGHEGEAVPMPSGAHAH